MVNKVKVITWNRYTIPNFRVTPELMGAKHKFEFDSYNVTVKVPSEEHATRNEGYDEVASLISWRESNGEKIPLEYSVEKVDINIEVKELQDIPEDASNSEHIDSSIYSEQSYTILNNVTEEYENIANRAFLYWLEILRWSSNRPRLGKGSPFSNESGWGTYLIDSKTGNRVFSSTRSINIQITAPVTEQEWQLTLNRVQSNTKLPMYMKFLHDSYDSAHAGNIQRATVELALCAENYLRYSVFELIPESLHSDFILFIEEANINQYLNRFFKNSLSKEDGMKFKKIKQNLSSLFDKRNKYMHMGKMDSINVEKYQRYLKAVNELLVIKLQNNQVGN